MTNRPERQSRTLTPNLRGRHARGMGSGLARKLRRMKSSLCLAACVTLLAGCASFEPAAPADYQGPTVNVADQVLPVSDQLVHVFEIRRVDSRRLLSSSIATLNANQGRGFSVKPVALSNELPLQPTRLQLLATTQWAAPILAMTHPTCQTEGEVSFAPLDGRHYRVAGRIVPDECAVWVEEIESGQPVTSKVTGKGTGR